MAETNIPKTNQEILNEIEFLENKRTIYCSDELWHALGAEIRSLKWVIGELKKSHIS